jgi:DNA-binding CsgD family transcriptional regulator/PAS domain-containing protein
MNCEAEVLSELIGSIYDTTIDCTLWPDVLKKSAEFVGGVAAAIYAKSASTNTGPIYHQFNIDPCYQELYLSKYVRMDPTSVGQTMTEIGQCVSTADIMPYEEFLETRFYREWAEPLGMVDCLSTPLDKNENGTVFFVVVRHRDQGLVDLEMRRRGQLIAPHIRRAVLVGNLLEDGAAEKTSLAVVLNGLAAGVFLIDGNRRVVFANPSGQAMLDDGSVLCLKNDALAAVDPRVTRTESIARLGDDDVGYGAGGVAIPLTFPPQTPWIAHLLPLTSGARRQAGTSFGAVAAVFVHKASLEAQSWMESMSRAFRLTPAELRVLAAVSEVGGIAAAASVVGVSEATVKTHLQSLFAKTGTNRQAELIKLVAAHVSPLRQK